MKIKPIKIKNTNLFNENNIPYEIVKICRKLKKNNFKAYLVGGCIRDLLINIKPKDFDIVTSAKPEQIKKIFKRNCRLIGKRFKLAHIYIKGREIVEVSTFRSNSSDNNAFGTEQEDVFKRDLTINALYYDVNSHVIIDYINGLNDIKNKNINIIGNIEERIIDDPVRMIRIIRYSTKTSFKINSEIITKIKELNFHIEECSYGRIFEELKKDLNTSESYNIFLNYYKTGLFEYLFPTLFKIWKDPQNKEFDAEEAFYILDIYDELYYNPNAIIGFSALFFPFFNMIKRKYPDKLKNKPDFLLNIAEKLIEPVSKKYQMPKYIVNQCCYNISYCNLIREYALTKKTNKKLIKFSKTKVFKGVIEFYIVLSEAIPEYFKFIEHSKLLSLSNYKKSYKYKKNKYKKNYKNRLFSKGKIK